MADEKISAIQTMLVTLPRARVIGRTRIYILHGKEARRCPVVPCSSDERAFDKTGIVIGSAVAP